MQHSNTVVRSAATFLALIFALPVAAGPTSNDGTFEFNKNGGFEIESADGEYRLSFGGRYQQDYNRFGGVINKKEDQITSDIFTRRARLKISGKAKDWSFKFSYNVKDGGSYDVLSATYGGWGKLLKITFGQQKEYFGLEAAGSSAWITGIERSMPSNAFATGKSVGIQVSGANDFLTYSLGSYQEKIDADDNSLDRAVTGRLVVRPVNKKRNLLHLGAGFTRRTGEFDGLGARLGVRGGEYKSANSAQVGHKGKRFANESKAWNLELAALIGRYHFMAEYFDAELSGALAAPNIGATGYYVQAGWTLTGESRGYKKSNGSLSDLSSKSPIGVWEVFGRFDKLDVSDNPNDPFIDIDGGAAITATLGINWYFGESTKVAVNYVYAETDQTIGGRTRGNGIAARIQYDF